MLNQLLLAYLGLKASIKALFLTYKDLKLLSRFYR